jgi:hypothetical protein
MYKFMDQVPSAIDDVSSSVAPDAPAPVAAGQPQPHQSVARASPGGHSARYAFMDQVPSAIYAIPDDTSAVPTPSLPGGGSGAHSVLDQVPSTADMVSCHYARSNISINHVFNTS